MKSRVRIISAFLVFLSLFIISGCDTDYPELEKDPSEVVDNFRDYYNNKVLAYFNSSGEFGKFEGSDGVDIAYAKFEAENEVGALVMLHGLNETYTKYSELIYDLRDTGFSIYIMEHRGHGNSGRILNGSDKEKRKVYINDFDNYVKDVKKFYDTVVNSKYHPKHYIFGHSLGGGIATLYIEKYRDDFDAAILSSPMMKIMTTHPKPVCETVAYPMSVSMVTLGKGKDYALDMEEPEILVDPDDKSKFESELLCKSWKRWKVYNEFILDNQHLLAGGPGATWGVTNKFAKLSYEATFKLRKKSEAEKIEIPILLFKCGEDWLGDISIYDKFKERAVNTDYFSIVEFPGSYHEAYMERDDIRSVFVNKTKEFLTLF